MLFVVLIWLRRLGGQENQDDNSNSPDEGEQQSTTPKKIGEQQRKILQMKSVLIRVTELG